MSIEIDSPAEARRERKRKLDDRKEPDESVTGDGFEQTATYCCVPHARQQRLKEKLLAEGDAEQEACR